jgi:hypothetical protein
MACVTYTTLSSIQTKINKFISSFLTLNLLCESKIKDINEKIENNYDFDTIHSSI